MKIYCKLDRPLTIITAVGGDECWKWFAGQEDGTFMTTVKDRESLERVCQMLEKVGASDIEYTEDE